MEAVASDWYRSFFGDEWLRFVAQRIPAEQTTREVDFIVETLALEPPASVLDLACGHGRHSLELARRGYEVTGLDLSEAALRVARDAARDAGLDVTFVHADMRELDSEAQFDAVVNWFTAFGYFEDDGQDQRVLERVARSLKPPGRFLIDTISPLWLFRHFEANSWTELEDGSLLLQQRAYEPLTGRNHVTWTLVHADGSRQELRHSVRVYTLVELTQMLARAGLQVERTWGDAAGSPYGLDTPRMIVLAQKAT